MVWVYDPKKGKRCNLIKHKNESGRVYVMKRKKGGGTKRKYLYPKRK